MTNQEAMHSMRNLNDLISITESERLSVEMAIKALEEQDRNRWIPVSERLPKTEIDRMTGYHKEYECTAFICGCRQVRTFSYADGKWWNGKIGTTAQVLAWRERPEPYKEDTE